jgi:tRNA/tmRNA/rRNA uracil-C5-methylase (TrmA/RlmC/RlmD family)
LSKTYKIDETLEVRVEKIVPNGLGLCFAENLTVFVPLSVKGDKLRVKIRKLQGKTAFAKIVEILEPAEDRIKPKCIYFGTCGGCDFQQMSYETQLKSKIGILRDSLKRIGKIDYEDEIPIIASPNEYNYRLRSNWHINSRQKKIGYFKRQSHDVIDAKSCPILVPELEATLKDLQENLEYGTLFAELINVEAASGENGEVSVYSEELVEPTYEVFYELNGEKFYFNAKSFFQSNKFLIKDLVEAAIENAEGKTALDLYCGVGLFSLSMAKNFEKVHGVEANKEAIDFANKNAEHARISNVEFHDERVKTFLSDYSFDDVDFVLLDPPRSGVKRGTLEKITKLSAERITYVSCNPSTLARDLQILLAEDYKIEKITALDLFPQTHHVETVVQLKK